MNEITYQNKVALNENASIPDINKVKADDMNEIKSVVNANSQTSSNNFGLGTDTWTSSGTYAIGDIVVYNENTYKNLTGTNTSTTPDQDSTNWEVAPLIVDEYSNSTTNAYNCDYVNNAIKDVYSTNETLTNKVWIDGKPIYRKVIAIGSISANVQKTGATGIVNCEYANLISTTGIASNGANNNISNAFIYDNGTNYSVIDNDAFTNVNMIIEYTKTTD